MSFRVEFTRHLRQQIASWQLSDFMLVVVNLRLRQDEGKGKGKRREKRRKGKQMVRRARAALMRGSSTPRTC